MKISADDLNFLRQMARDVIEASRVKPGQRVANSPPNALGFTGIKPGGRNCYPAVWVRDFSMSLDCGLIPREEILAHFELFKSKQNGPQERKLKSGAVVPPHSIPDHVNFDGGAVYFPGTYSAGEDQGAEPFGITPPVDDNLELVHIAHHLKIKSAAVDRAFAAVPIDEVTGMIKTTAKDRAVGFGFYDAIYLTGSMLFPSIVRHRAAVELGRMDVADQIRKHFVPVFAEPEHRHGWLLAATDVGRVPDVWGTLYALHLNLLPDDFAKLARQTVADALTRGTISFEGAVRHVPTDHDASPTSAWPKVVPGVAVNAYQNGAYWHTPTGWLISALHRSHPDLAAGVWGDYLAHLREQDFRKGATSGAPWECFGKSGRARQNPVYMTSVTVPLAVVEQL